MKKTNLKILVIILSIILLLGMLTTKSKAVGSFSASCSSTSVYVGDTITITVNANNAAGMYLVSIGNSNVSLTSGSNNEFIENSSATITYKAVKAGTVTITASASDMTDLEDSTKKVTGSKSFSITIKEKDTGSSSGTTNPSGGSSSSGGNSSSSGGSTNTTKPKTPTFKNANKTVYTTGDVNLRSSWSTSSAATTVKEGTELKLTGTSTETINGYVWYRVSYNGATKYIASSLITETKPKEDPKNEEKPKEEEPKEEPKDDEKSSNKSLSSLSIEGIELTPKFDKETTQYTAKVDGDVTELKIDYKAENSKAKVAVEGNKDLKEGDNIIKVKVTAEDDTTRTYFITVTKGEGTEIDTSLQLSELSIARVNFADTFKPDVYTYELSLNTYVDKLDITATPNQADAKVEITGNSEFKAGKNMITILLTSADGTKTATYQIEVNLPEAVAQSSNNSDTFMYIGIGVVIAIIIILVFLFIIRRKNRNKEIDVEQVVEEEPDMIKNEFLENAEEEKTKQKKSKGRHSI